MLTIGEIKTGAENQKLQRITSYELKEKLGNMRPEDRDQLLGDILEQLKRARANPNMGPDQTAQVDEAIEAVSLRLKMNPI